MIRGIIVSIAEGVIKRFTASGRSDETISDREYFQHYGYTSRPKAGAEIIIIREGGHFVAVASDDRRYRIAMADGEVSLYDDLGQKIHLTRTGIVVESPLQITAKAPLIKLDGYVKTTNHIEVGSGVSGTFSAGSKAVNVKNGIIVGIS